MRTSAFLLWLGGSNFKRRDSSNTSFKSHFDTVLLKGRGGVVFSGTTSSSAGWFKLKFCQAVFAAVAAAGISLVSSAVTVGSSFCLTTSAILSIEKWSSIPDPSWCDVQSPEPLWIGKVSSWDTVNKVK